MPPYFQFQRTTATESIQESICQECGRPVGSSASTSALDIAERAHICQAKPKKSVEPKGLAFAVRTS
jgi:hypothetical protein